MEYKTLKSYRNHVLSDKRSDRLSTKITGKYHYVYRVTHILSNTYYYGCRVSILTPLLDLSKYCTSSSKKQHIKNNPEEYTFKIIAVYNNNLDKIIHESFLHQYFNVKINKNFWNKANQTPFGFDCAGVLLTQEHKDKIGAQNKGRVFSTETRYKMSKIHKGKIISKEQRKRQSEISKLQVHSKDRRIKASIRISGINNPMYGRPITDEMREFLSKKNTGNGNPATYNLAIYSKDGSVQKLLTSYELKHKSNHLPHNALIKTLKQDKVIGTGIDDIKTTKIHLMTWEGCYARKIIAND